MQTTQSCPSMCWPMIWCLQCTQTWSRPCPREGWTGTVVLLDVGAAFQWIAEVHWALGPLWVGPKPNHISGREEGSQAVPPHGSHTGLRESSVFPGPRNITAEAAWETWESGPWNEAMCYGSCLYSVGLLSVALAAQEWL